MGSFRAQFSPVVVSARKCASRGHAWALAIVLAWHALEAPLAPLHVGRDCVRAAEPSAESSGDDRNAWETVAVPGVAETADPTVWYRAWVRVPDAWASREGLLADSVVLTLEGVSDVAAVHVNGVLVGHCGSASPALVSARDEVHRFKVPPGTLRSEHYNAITIQMFSPDRRIGFVGRAPVLSGYLEEAVLAGPWERHPGKDLAEAERLPRADRPRSAVFERFGPATSALRRPERLTPGRHLEPEASLAAMKTADDLAVDLVLSEPQIGQPLALDFDSRGRLWVVEYRQYPYPQGLTMVSRDKYYRAAYDRMPEPPPRGERGLDRVSIHEDADGDGVLENHKTFVDGLNIVSSVEVMDEGVWVLNPPYLLFYPDRNHDDVPDGDPEVHLEGFGLEDTHSIANSLTWSADGWLYGAQGSTTSSRILVRGRDAPAVYRDGAMIWRYHPGQRRYEVFAEGGGNSFGIEINSAGHLFSGHNGGNTRGFHYHQGAFYQKGTDDKYGPLSNPFAFGFLLAMGHAESPRFSHDLVIYEGTGLPEAYRGKLFSIDPLQQRVVLADIEPDGSTFRTTDRSFPLETSDLAFRPIDITTGPDGALYIADFCEEFIAHGQHFQGQVAPETGRVWRLRARREPVEDAASGGTLDAATKPRLSPRREPDLRSLGSQAWLELLEDPDRWMRRTATRLLIERPDLDARPALEAMLEAMDHPAALEALWVLHAWGGPREDLMRRGLTHARPGVRRWAVRLLGDSRQTPSDDLRALLLEMARQEKDPTVRAQLACSAQRWEASFALRLLEAWVSAADTQANVPADPCLPLLAWWALESKAGHREEVLRWLSQPAVRQQPLVRETLMPRLARRYASGPHEDLEAYRQLLTLAVDATAREAMVAAFEEAFAGRSLAEVPESVVRAIQQAGGGSQALRIRQGDRPTLEEAVASVWREGVRIEQRVAAVRLLGELADERGRRPLREALASSPHAEVAFEALQVLRSDTRDRVATEALRRWPSWTHEQHGQALRLLATRVNWARSVLFAIEQGSLPREAVPRDVVQQLSLLDNPSIADEVRRLWPDLDQDTGRAQAETNRVRRALEAGGSDPYTGRELYRAHCAKCHTLYREGGQIGPNLTSYARHQVANLLLQVVNPSLEIREGFETWVAELDDGRVVSGFLADQDPHALVLRTVDGANVRVPRDAVEQLRRDPRSLMPAGLTERLSEQQLRDLFAFLRLSQPLN